MWRSRGLYGARRLASWLALGCIALSCLVSYAQDSGQICLQAYEDLNEDGQRADTEAVIARGIAASLLDERGVTISAQLLEDSPAAADGLVCFDGLLAGDYRVIISSSEYIATTASSAEARVRPGSAPARIDFGARPLAPHSAPTVTPAFAGLDADAMPVVLFAIAVVMAALTVSSLLAFLVVVLYLRRRAKMRQRQTSAPAGLPSASLSDGESLPPRLAEVPHEGSPLLFTDNDQQW